MALNSEVYAIRWARTTNMFTANVNSSGDGSSILNSLGATSFFFTTNIVIRGDGWLAITSCFNSPALICFRSQNLTGQRSIRATVFFIRLHVVNDARSLSRPHSAILVTPVKAIGSLTSGSSADQRGAWRFRKAGHIAWGSSRKDGPLTKSRTLTKQYWPAVNYAAGIPRLTSSAGFSNVGT